MNKNIVEINRLFLIFGRERNRAFKMLMSEKSPGEVLRRTGCTIAINNVHLSIREGEILAIMGLPGSGKSSLIRCINRLYKPTFGEIRLNGKNIVSATEEEVRNMRRKEVAMVFQHFGLLPHYTVGQNVALGLDFQKIEKEERDKKVVEALHWVGLDGYEHRAISELTDGMQQRVGWARAFAMEPELLLMDEAFAALDPVMREQMREALLDWHSQKKNTIVFVTHSLQEAIQLGDRIAIMRDGELERIGLSEEILAALANGYEASLIEKRGME